MAGTDKPMPVTTQPGGPTATKGDGIRAFEADRESRERKASFTRKDSLTQVASDYANKNNALYHSTKHARRESAIRRYTKRRCMQKPPICWDETDDGVPPFCEGTSAP